MEWISGEVAAATKQCMVANLRVQEYDENLRKQSQTSNDQEVILNYLRSNITPPCSLLDPLEKRPSRLHTRLGILIRIWWQVLYNRILKTPIYHITVGTAFERSNPAGVSQLSPLQAHDPRRQSSIAGHPIRLGVPVHKTFRRW